MYAGLKSTILIVLAVSALGGGCMFLPAEDYTSSAFSSDVRRRLAQIPDGAMSDTVSDLPDTLELNGAVSLALSNNRSLRLKRHALLRAIQEKRVASASVLTSTLSADYTINDDSGSGAIDVTYGSVFGLEFTPFIDLTLNKNSVPTHVSEFGISISRKLFNSEERVRLRLPITLANKDFMKSLNDVVREERTLRFTTTREFLNIQRAQATVRIRENRVKDASAFLNDIKNRVKQGFAAAVDEVNALITQNQAEADLINETTNLRSAVETLLDTLGFGLDRNLAIVAIDVAKAPPADFDLAVDTTRLVTTREELINQRLDIDYAEKELRIQKDKLRPQLAVSVTPRVKLDDDEFFGTRNKDTKELTFGLSYSTTLDWKRSDRAKLKQLELSQRERVLSLRNTERTLKKQLRNLHRRIDQLKIRSRLEADRLKAEGSKLAATLQRFDQGNVDNLEVTRAKQALDDADVRLLDSRIDLRLAVEEYMSLLPAQQEEAAPAD